MSVKFEEVHKIAPTLENVEEVRSYGTAGFKVGGELFARLKEDGETLVVRMGFYERHEMIATDPGVYFVTDHYLNYKWIMVRLHRIELDALRDLLRGEWRRPRRRPRKSDARAAANASRGPCKWYDAQASRGHKKQIELFGGCDEFVSPIFDFRVAG